MKERFLAWVEFFLTAASSKPEIVLLAYGIWPLGGNYAQMQYTLRYLPRLSERTIIVCNLDTVELGAEMPWATTLVLPWRSRFIAGKWLAQYLLGVIMTPRIWHRLAGEAMLWPVHGYTSATIADLNYYHLRPTSAVACFKQLHFQLTMMCVDRVYAISRFTARDLVRHGVSFARVCVLYHGAGKPGVSAVSGTQSKRPYVLTFGQHAHKRCDLVVSAVAKIRATGGDLRVVCLGGMKSRAAVLTKAGLQESTDWYETPSWLADDVVKAMYGECALVAFITDFEGFGLPMLEAFEAGARILASDLEVLREIGGDGAIYCDQCVEDIAAGIKDLLNETDPQRTRRVEAQKGILRNFSWDNVGQVLASEWSSARLPYKVI